VRQWKALQGRVADNYERMRANGMSIHLDSDIDAALRAKLREAGRIAVDEWAAKAGPEGKALLDRAAR
jgi:TRAP-type C4-dicarboxylate transport system substrate-binding protein